MAWAAAGAVYPVWVRLWALLDAGTGVFVGQVGLTIQDTPGGPELEIGYLLKRRFWHRGYAVRAAAACRDFAFTSLEAPRVVSIIRDTNEASKRVAERSAAPRIHLCQAVLWEG